MSIAMRLDVGMELGCILYPTCGGDGSVGPFDAMVNQRWQGYAITVGVGDRNPHKNVVTLYIKLPTQIAKAWELSYKLLAIAKDCENRGGAYHLLTSIVSASRALGMSMGTPTRTPTDDLELSFFDSLHKAPGDLATWSAYADWLQDQQDEATVRRGTVIAGWLGPKPLKMKQGRVPYLALGEEPPVQYRDPFKVRKKK